MDIPGKAGTVQIGEQVPDFTAALDDGRRVAFSELLEDGPAVVFFYPKAFTSGCTAESCHFRDLSAEFADLGAQRIGVSRDSVSTQGRFRAEYRLDFPLIADPDGTVARAFGAKRLGPLPSKRQTYVVDRDRTLLGVVSSELNMDIHADQALEMLREHVGITLPEPAEAGSATTETS
jgi:thioredoxin-dependent peroxiredoxin